jgi:hypothetical protein
VTRNRTHHCIKLPHTGSNVSADFRRSINLQPDLIFPFGRWCQTTWKVFFSLISAKKFLSPVLSIVCNHGLSAVVGVGRLHRDIQTLKQPSISGIDGDKDHCTTLIIKSFIRTGEWTSDSTTMSNNFFSRTHRRAAYRCIKKKKKGTSAPGTQHTPTNTHMTQDKKPNYHRPGTTRTHRNHLMTRLNSWSEELATTSTPAQLGTFTTNA